MSILKADRNQSLDRMTKQFLAVISEQFFCLRIDEDDFPSFIDDDHRVWRRLKQLTEREDFALHIKLRVPRHGAHTTPLYRVSPRLSRLPWTWRRYCLHPKCARGPCRW